MPFKGVKFMESSFLELRNKEVINITNGKCLGNIIDIIFDCRTGEVLGLVVPDCRHFFKLFQAADDIFIPFASICKIGEDAILVELYDCDPKRNAFTCEVEDKNPKTAKNKKEEF